MLPRHFALMLLNQQAKKGVTVLVEMISLTSEGMVGYFFMVRQGRVCQEHKSSLRESLVFPCPVVKVSVKSDPGGTTNEGMHAITAN